MSKYWDRIPEWNREQPELSFEITADKYSGRIPVTRLEDWREFTALLESPFFDTPGVQLVFRGHRRYDWEMMPTLARITQNGIVTKELADQQLALFRKAIRGRVTDHSLLEEGPEDDELWSIGQHHSLMTPLLDWTYSPYVALFFAFSKEDQQDERDNPYRAVYVLNKTFIADDDKCPDIRVFEPRKDDHGRLVSQAGLFTFSPYDATIENKLTSVLAEESLNDSKLMNASEDEQAAIIAQYICKIYIKNEEQKECLKFLRRMNVHHASLFPDLIGAAEYCNVTMSELAYENQLREQESDRQLLVDEPVSESAPVAEAIFLPSSNASNVSEFRGVLECSDVEPGRLDLIAEELDRYLSKSMVVDWQERETVQAEMKNTIRVLLRRYGYPINEREAVVESVLEIARRINDD